MAIDAPLLFDRGEEYALWVNTQEELHEAIPSAVQLYFVCFGDSIVESYGVVLQQISETFENLGQSWDMVLLQPVETKRHREYRARQASDMVPPTKYSFCQKSDMIPFTAVDWTVM